MAEYRRWYVPGGTVFFTVVTYNRKRIFQDKGACTLLGCKMREIRDELPYKTVALVVLPDHLHAIWTLPEGDEDFSTRWKKIKRNFTVDWLAAGGVDEKVTRSQARRGHRGVWQRRFWEHQVRDEDEMEALFDYVHYNPVKHKYVSRPWDWPFSTFRRYVDEGYYSKDWGKNLPESVTGDALAEYINEPS